MKLPDPKPTSKVFRRQSRAFNRHLAGAVEGDARAVHRARVASRRLRESIPLLAVGLKRGKSKKARRGIRRVARALGLVRELDVSLRIADELGQSADMPAGALEEVRAYLQTERQVRRDAMLERLERVDTGKLRRRLAAVLDALCQDVDERWRRTLGKRLLKRAKRLSAAVDEAGSVYAADRLHEVRIAAKKLRYALELAAAGGVDAAAPLVDTLKNAQQTLGRIQDLQVLREHVAATQTRPNGQRAPSSEFDAIAARIDDESRMLHGRYLDAATELADLTGSVRSAVVPHLARPSGELRALRMGVTHRTGSRAAGGER